MTSLLFGLLILALFAIALFRRSKEKKEWVAEERHEETGHWIDKRAGERGTFGSLDAEMENERFGMANQHKINELHRVIREYFVENSSGFSDLPTEKIRETSAVFRQAAADFSSIVGQTLGGNLPEPKPSPGVADTFSEGLKKRILGAAYDHFPKLLDLNLEAIQRFDLAVGAACADLKNRI